MVQGKAVVITGGGRGIGRAVALHLGKAGARLVVNDYGVTVDGREPNSVVAEEVAAEIRTAGGDAVAHGGDVSRMADVEALVGLALRVYGRLDGIVCVAGILRDRMIFNMTEEEWDDVIAVHLKGHFACFKYATQIMRQQRFGSIVAFTSGAGLEGSPGQPNYAAAKAGVVGLVRSTALAMAKYNVRVNAVSPRAETRMADVANQSPFQLKGRMAYRPEDVAPVVEFLLSDRSAHITGQVYTSAGGLVARWKHPVEERTVYCEEGWTAEKLEIVHDSQLGMDELRRFAKLGLPRLSAVQTAGQEPPAAQARPTEQDRQA